MSAISGGAAALASASPATAPGGFSELSSEEFVRILVSELTRQDPLAPQDSSALLEQLSSIRSIESDLSLTNQLQSLVTENQLASAGNLIGTFVSGVTDTNQRTEGFVVSINRTDSGAILNLSNGSRVGLSRVDEIIDPRQFAPDPAPPSGPPSTGGPTTPTPTPTSGPGPAPPPRGDPPAPTRDEPDRALAAPRSRRGDFDAAGQQPAGANVAE
ncbi:MAG: hypothetical protein C0513_05525 [Isosphaera sp.]|nr:hypothetical protein [Isosphaera sp.]